MLTEGRSKKVNRYNKKVIWFIALSFLQCLKNTFLSFKPNFYKAKLASVTVKASVIAVASMTLKVLVTSVASMTTVVPVIGISDYCGISD